MLKYLFLAIASTLGGAALQCAAAQSTLVSSAALDAGESIVQQSDFGGSLSATSEWVAVGADQSVAGLEGEVFLYQRVGGTVFQLEAEAIGENQGDAFGAAVALDTSSGAPMLLVGAPDNDAQASKAGRAYVLDLISGQLQLWGVLDPATFQQNAGFGTAVATDQEVFAVSQPFEIGAGRVFVWDRLGGALNSLSTLTPSNGGGIGDEFGRALALDGARLVVGAPMNDDAAQDAGAVHIYEQAQPGGSFQPLTPLPNARVLASDAGAGDEFGASVALEGDLLVVGAPLNGDGAAYVFRRQVGGNFVEEATLTVPAAGSNARVGSSVAIDGGRILVGAERALTGNGTTGAAYVFEDASPGAGQWNASWKLEATGAEANDAVGASVALTGDFPLVGAPRADAVKPSDGQEYADAGRAFVFDLSVGVCIADIATEPSGGPADRFGEVIAAGGGFVAVGAPSDDSLGSEGGAVSVFTDTAAVLDHEQLLVPSSLPPASALGSALALDAPRLLAGAPGWLGDPFASGAAVFYERDPGTGTWIELQVIGAPVPLRGDRFGAAVDLSGDRAVVGSPGTDGGRGAVSFFDRDPVSGLLGLVDDHPAATDLGSAELGASVALSPDGNLAAIGAPGADLAGGDAGAAVIFRRWARAVRDANRVTIADPVFGGQVSGNDRLHHLSFVGDLDGDGSGELAVGAVEFNAPGGGAKDGVLWILSFDSEGVPSAGVELQASGSWGNGTVQKFGGAVAVGDFDSNPATAEMVVTAWDTDGGGKTNTGTALLFDVSSFPAISTPPVDLLAGGVAGQVSIPSNAQLDEVVNLGDLDGNGVDDLGFAAAGAGAGSGLVYVSLMGDGALLPSGTELITVGDIPASALSNPVTGQPVSISSFGQSIASLGDPDGAGPATGSIAIGSPRADNVHSEDGLVLIVWLGADGGLHAPGGVPVVQLIGEGFGGFPGLLTDDSWFGTSVSSLGDVDGDGDTDLLVGERHSTLVGSTDPGSAWIVLLDPLLQVEAALELTSEAGGEVPVLPSGDEFGFDVAAIGPVADPDSFFVAVSSRPSTNDGDVWILDLGPRWLDAGTALAAMPAAGDRFGSAVVLSENALAVGAPGSDGSSAQEGAVHAFEVDSTGAPSAAQLLTPGQPVADELLGSALSLQDGRLFVGAPGSFASGVAAGRVVEWARTGAGETWYEVDQITSPAGDVGERFGSAASIAGSTLVIGAPRADGPGPDQGNVYSVSLTGSGCGTILANADTISIATGGTQTIYVAPGTEYGTSAQHFYLLLASFGAGPTPVGQGLLLPLSFDAILLYSLQNANAPPFLNTFGTLDPTTGEAQAQIALPDTLPPSVIGQTLYTAYLVLAPFPSLAPVFASEAVSLELVP